MRDQVQFCKQEHNKHKNTLINEIQKAAHSTRTLDKVASITGFRLATDHRILILQMSLMISIARAVSRMLESKPLNQAQVDTSPKS